MKKRNNNKNRNRIIGLGMIGVFIGILIYVIDGKKSQYDSYKRDVRGDVEAAKAERECVNVELSQLNEFLSVLSHSTSEFVNIKTAVYDSEDSTTYINVKDASSAKRILLGPENNTERWSKYYKKDGTVIFFETEIRDGDTIVHCPAYTFAKLVDSYEKEQRKK